MTIVISLLVVAGFSLLLWKAPFFRSTGLKSWQVVCAFYVKLLVAVVFCVVFTNYPAYKNQSDSQAFYRSAAQFAAIAHENFGDYVRASFHIPVKTPEIREKLPKIDYWNRPYDNSMPNDTRQTLILYSWVYLVSFGSLPVMLIVANFLAFCGLFALFKAFLLWLRLRSATVTPVVERSRNVLSACIACFAIPSTLFWSSGLLKEVWLLFFMGFTVYSSTMFFTTKNLRFAIFALLWGIALLHIKIYIALCLLPLLGIYAIRTQWNKPKAIVFYGSTCTVFIFCAFCAFWFLNFNIVEILVQQRNTFIRMLEAHNHATIILQTFDTSSNFVAQIFVGLWNVLLRPNMFNTQNVFVFFAGLENTIIAVLIMYSIIVWAKNRVAVNDYTIVMIAFVLAVCVIIGFTTPNMGALMRYKSPLLPFVVVLLHNSKKNVT